MAYKITHCYLSFIFVEINFYWHSCMMFTMQFMNICNQKVNYEEIIIHQSLVFKHRFCIFLLVGNLKRISNYLKRIMITYNFNMQ